MVTRLPRRRCQAVPPAVWSEFNREGGDEWSRGEEAKQPEMQRAEVHRRQRRRCVELGARGRGAAGREVGQRDVQGSIACWPKEARTGEKTKHNLIFERFGEAGGACARQGRRAIAMRGKANGQPR